MNVIPLHFFSFLLFFVQKAGNKKSVFKCGCHGEWFSLLKIKTSHLPRNRIPSQEYDSFSICKKIFRFEFSLQSRIFVIQVDNRKSLTAFPDIWANATFCWVHISLNYKKKATKKVMPYLSYQNQPSYKSPSGNFVFHF